MWLAPIICYVALLLVFITKSKNPALAYWCSAIAIAAIMCSAAFALFPFIVPSSLDISGIGSQSLTIWNISSSQFSLMGMLYITFVSMVLIITYKLWAFSAAWRGKSKLERSDLQENEHTFY
jgi:cytochrome d ubiquinol oxidase subunit II